MSPLMRRLEDLLPLLVIAPPLFAATLVLGRLVRILSGAEPWGEEIPMILSEARGLLDGLRAGDPSGWIHGANLGYPAGLFTPVLPSLLVAMVAWGGTDLVTALKLCLMAALVLQPITTAIGLRLGGLSPWRASFGGFAVAMITSMLEFGVGVEGAFRTGLYPQTWALVALPLACGAGVRCIRTGERAFLAMGAAVLVVLCEPIHMVSVALVWGVALAARPDARGLETIARLVIGVAVSSACAWLPALVHHTYYGGGPRRAAGADVEIESALALFFTGDAVDAGHGPWLTGLAALGGALALVRWRLLRVRDERIALGAVALCPFGWLLIAPLGLPDEVLAVGRVLVLAQLAWAALAGVALVDVVEIAWRLSEGRPQRALVAWALVALVVSVGVGLHRSADPISRQMVGTLDADPRTGRALLAPILAAVDETPRPRGRIAAIGETGFPARMLPHVYAGAPPLWASAGPALAASPNGWLPHRDDVARFTTLYNVSSVVTLADAEPVSRVELASSSLFSLWAVEGGGGMWLPVTAGEIVDGNTRAWRAAVRSWASRKELGSHPLRGTPAGTSDDDLREARGAAGRVEVLDSREGPGAFAATVRASADGPRLLALKVSSSPLWQATVDGAPAPVWRVAPDLPAVLVPPGEHAVRFEAVRPFWMWLLVLLAPGLMAVCVVWVRASARRLP